MDEQKDSISLSPEDRAKRLIEQDMAELISKINDHFRDYRQNTVHISVVDYVEELFKICNSGIIKIADRRLEEWVKKLDIANNRASVYHEKWEFAIQSNIRLNEHLQALIDSNLHVTKAYLENVAYVKYIGDGSEGVKKED